MTLAQLDARALARALGGEVSGRNRILAPGPGHSRQDRSLSITLDPGAPDGLLVNSFAGDDWRVCRDYVLQRVGVERTRDRRQGPIAHDGIRRRVTQFTPSHELDESTEARIKRAVVIWDEGQDPCGTIVERYLNEERHLHLPEELVGAVLRFHPSCPWKDENGQLIRVPAMIAAMRCIRTDRLKAVHRTRLTPDAKKVDRRMLGDATEAAIKLDPDEKVTTGLIIGEGVETTLAARQLGFKPAWATGSVSTMGTFPVLSGIEALTLLSETDKKGANARAIEACGTRWHEAGCEVLTVASKAGGDINDAIQNKGRAAQ